MAEIQLGSIVKDTITGYTGMAVGRTIFLTGCARISVQPTKLDSKGEVRIREVFDEPQLRVISLPESPVKSISRKTKKRGGPGGDLQKRVDIPTKLKESHYAVKRL